MTPAELLTEIVERIKTSITATLDGIDEQILTKRPGPDANSIAWLIWHLSRVQDAVITMASGQEQAWTAGGFAEEFALPFKAKDTGFGHSSEQVAQVHASADALGRYYDAVHAKTLRYLATVTGQMLDEVVGERYGKPLTGAGRLLMIVNDNLQHAGQAAYLKGLFAA